MKSLILTLLVALNAVESSNGTTSHNQFQIRDICIIDVNRIYGTSYTMYDAYNYKKSKDIAILYLTYWGNEYAKQTNLQPTYQVYARIWNGGPNGWKKKSTIKYWKKVKSELTQTLNKQANKH